MPKSFLHYFLYFMSSLQPKLEGPTQVPLPSTILFLLIHFLLSLHTDTYWFWNYQFRGADETSHLWRVLSGLSEDQIDVSSQHPHGDSQPPNSSSRRYNAPFWPQQAPAHVYYRYTHTGSQYTHEEMNESFLKGLQERITSWYLPELWTQRLQHRAENYNCLLLDRCNTNLSR